MLVLGTQCNVMISCFYILWNNHPNKSNQYLSPCIVTKRFLWWEFLRSTLLAAFRYKYSIINHHHHAVHYIPMTYLFHNWKFVPLDSVTHFTHLPTSGNHQSVLCIYEFKGIAFVCLDSTNKLDRIVGLILEIFLTYINFIQNGWFFWVGS